MHFSETVKVSTNVKDFSDNPVSSANPFKLAKKSNRF